MAKIFRIKNQGLRAFGGFVVILCWVAGFVGLSFLTGFILKKLHWDWFGALLGLNCETSTFVLGLETVCVLWLAIGIFKISKFLGQKYFNSISDKEGKKGEG